MELVIQQKDTHQIIASGQEDNGSVVILENNWYFAPDAVDMTHLKITSRPYTCPYKGVCYWLDLDAPDLKAKNIAWVYNDPKPGYERIKGKIAFYSRDTVGTVALKDAVRS
ncbi:MAG TPA: DUF427 domain-containing protein [Phototrophicaceae bacterium]|jgi:uncharacterized protein (DUF427 family)|nr:DUF427 domain-containing protein [Phototrophicaceae bacterium]